MGAFHELCVGRRDSVCIVETGTHRRDKRRRRVCVRACVVVALRTCTVTGDDRNVGVDNSKRLSNQDPLPSLRYDPGCRWRLSRGDGPTTCDELL